MLGDAERQGAVQWSGKGVLLHPQLAVAARRVLLSLVQATHQAVQTAAVTTTADSATTAAAAEAAASAAAAAAGGIVVELLNCAVEEGAELVEVLEQALCVK